MINDLTLLHLLHKLMTKRHNWSKFDQLEYDRLMKIREDLMDQEEALS